MQYEEGLADEVAEILRSPIFARAPRQAQLLRFLASRAIRHERRISQYDIAVDALGKSATFDESSDSYVRSSMSRLRKSLRSYYSEHLPKREVCIFNKPGEYFLRMAELRTAYPELAEMRDDGRQISDSTQNRWRLEEPNSQLFSHEPNESTSSSSVNDLSVASLPEAETAVASLRVRRFIRSGVVLSVLLLSAILVSIVYSNSSTTASGQVPQSKPTVKVDAKSIGTTEFKEQKNLLLSATRIDLTEIVASSFVTQKEARSEHSSDYFISIVLQQNVEGVEVSSLMLTDRAGESLYERQIELTGDLAEDRRLIYDNLVELVAPAGQISRDLALRLPQTPRSDFECFILAENSRAKGLLTAEVVDLCLREYPSSEYYPFFLGRQIWMNIQNRALQGIAVEVDSTIWAEVGQAINDHPNNPYLNMIAAKILTARSECSATEPFANRALESGRSFPAMEMALLIEAYGCHESEALNAQKNRRIRQLVDANPIPNDLLKLYLLLGLIISDQPPSNELFALENFDHLSQSSFNTLNTLLAESFVRPLSQDEHQQLRKILPAVVFNSKVRERILDLTKPNEDFVRRRSQK